MNSLKETGEYTITEDMKKNLADFEGGYAPEKNCFDKINSLYSNTGYVIDTHTSVAASVYDEYKKATGDDKVTVVASTASPYKFMKSVMTAIDSKYSDMDDFALIDELSKVSGTDVPKAVDDIRNAPVLHTDVCEKDEMKDMVKKFLGI